MRARAATAALATLLLSSSALAQGSDGQRAIDLGKAGLELYQAGKFSECAAKFEAADTLSHSPVFRLYKARCLRGDGKLLRAIVDFRSLVEEKLADDAPGPWKTAQGDAKVELAQAERAVPRVLVKVKGGDGAKLTIDGGVATAAQSVALDPGLHKAEAVLGDKKREATFELKESQAELIVEIDLGAGDQAGSGAGAGGGVGPAPGPAPAPSTGGVAPGLIPGAVMMGVGGAAAVAGAVLGGLALGSYGEMKDANCTRSDSGDLVGCDPGSELHTDELTATDAMADASTGLLISGGVVAAVGLVLILALPAEDAPAVKAGALELRF